MMVPKRRPPNPHSCSWSRSPLRQCAAAKPSHVMKPNSAMKMIRAVQFTSCTACLPRLLGLISCVSGCLIPRWRGTDLVFGREIDDRGQNGPDDDPEHLVPIKERDARPRRLGGVVERRPQHRDELNDEEQVPPAPARALVSFLIHESPPRVFHPERAFRGSCGQD